jgi:hypothetical protein
MAEKPYYEPHYLELIKQAREKHLGNIQATSAAIIRLYREAAADLAERAAASRKGSLSQRWADEYAKSLAKRAAELEAGLYDVTLQGLKRSAELPAAAMGQWWEAVGGQSFRDAFAMPQDNVLAGIIEGGFYKDNQGLSRRIWRLADSFEKDIGYIVQRGIAEKKSALELARDLEQYVKPPAAREWDWGKVYPDLSGKKVDFNAQRLARTSINHAYFLDNVKVCTENPFVTAMHWDLSNSHYERQVIPFGPDECDEYAAHDEGLGEGNWKPEEIPVPHPQCLCAHWPVIPQDLEDIGAQIGRWASGEPDAVLDEWYDKYGNRNPNGDPKEILREGLKYQGNSGIIKTRGLTKLTENNKVVNPMDEAKYIRMKSGLEKIGCTVISAHGDDERFLIHFGAEAISDSHGILHLGDIPSASAFFEEIIHFAQMRKYGDMQTDDMIERTAREVAANRKLLAHGTEYGFTQEDFEDIRNNLAFWEKDFIRKVGVSYEESDFDRGI